MEISQYLMLSSIGRSLSVHKNPTTLVVGVSEIDEVLRMVCTKDIVEYNEVDGPHHYHDERVLIRGRQVYNVDIVDSKTKKMIRCACQLCLVVSLISGTLVTAYYNKVDDNHLTLNQKRYNVNLQIIKEY